MNHIIDIRMLRKDLCKAGLIGDVDLVELRSLPGDELDPVDALFGRVVQVVDDDDLVVCLQQCENGEGADVACSAVLENYYR